MKKSIGNRDFYLIEKIKTGEKPAFRELFDKYAPKIYRFAFSYLKNENDAEDVVQEVFMKIWRKRKEIDYTKSFQSYLFTISLNVIRKQFNKLAKSNQLKHDLLFSFASNKSLFDDNNDFQEMVDKLEVLIQQLPERRRKIFKMKKLEGKSQKDIAKIYDITTKTVEYHITEAMKFLRIEFEKLRKKGIIFFCLFVKNK